MTCEPGLVPELSVTDYEASRHFWCDLVGFSLRYERPEEGFGYLVLGSAHLMLDQINRGRTWETGSLEPPLGRGINFEVQVENVDTVLRRIESAGSCEGVRAPQAMKLPRRQLRAMLKPEAVQVSK